MRTRSSVMSLRVGTVLWAGGMLLLGCRADPPARPAPSESGASAYYDHVIRQVVRCFGRHSEDDLEAVVQFVVERDGTVSELELVEGSGDPAFDAAALEAVECAGRNGGLGPLPEALPGERFPVRFSFRPGGEIRWPGNR